MSTGLIAATSTWTMNMSELPLVSSQLNIFPDLPLDVTRYILKTAAYMNQATTLQLVMVSNLNGTCSINIILILPLPLLQDRPHSKMLVFDSCWWSLKQPIICLICLACLCVTSITWWMFYDLVLPYACLDTPNLFITHLYLFENFPYTVKCIPCSITHLLLTTEYIVELRANTLPQIIAYCPNLTHICVNFQFFPNTHAISLCSLMTFSMSFRSP